jgi:hypothetical protein
MQIRLKLLFLILSFPFILSSVIILFIFRAQANLSDLKINLFGQTIHLDELHNSNSEACEGMEFNSAEEAFLYAEQLSKAGGSTEEAIAAYTCAIQLDPQMAKAYVFRSIEFALTPGQEHLGIVLLRCILLVRKDSCQIWAGLITSGLSVETKPALSKFQL